MYYIIDRDEDRRFETVDEVCDYVFDESTYDDDDGVEEWVNDIYSGVEIAGYDFSAGEIVRALNEYLWNDLCSEWAQSRAESDRDCYYSDIECLEPGEEGWFNDFRVEAREDEDEETEEEIEEFNNILQASYVVKTISDNPTNVQIIG